MKSYSKGAKLRNKKSLPELAGVKRRKNRGSKRMKEIRDTYDPAGAKTVLEARARSMGLDPSNPKHLEQMKSQALTDDAGRALVIAKGKDAAPLVESYAALTGSYERYARRGLGVSPHPKTGKIEMMPDKMPDAMEYTPDLRSDDEKDRAASRAWDIWRGRMDKLALGESASIWSAFYGWSTLHDGGTLTKAGERFVTAMVSLQDAVDGREGTR